MNMIGRVELKGREAYLCTQKKNENFYQHTGFEFLIKTNVNTFLMIIFRELMNLMCSNNHKAKPIKGPCNHLF